MNRRQIINAACACETCSGIWFVHYAVGILMFYDFLLQKVTIAKVIPGINRIDIAPFTGIIEYQSKIYMFPNNAQGIIVYEMETEQFRTVDIKKYGSQHIFRGAYRKGDVVYAMPYRYPYVIKMDLKTEEIKYISGFTKEYSEDKAPYSNACTEYLGRYYINAMPGTNTIATFDIETERWRVDETGEENYSYITAVEDNIYAFDFAGKTICQIEMSGEAIKKTNPIGFNSIALQAMKDGCILANDGSSGKVKVYDAALTFVKNIEINIIKSGLSTKYLQSYWLTGKDKVYGITKSNELLILREHNGIERKDLFMDRELWQEVCNEYVKTCNIVAIENEIWGLDAFLMQLERANQKWKKCAN